MNEPTITCPHCAYEIKLLEEQVSTRLKVECITIAADEAKKVKLILAADPEEKSKQLTELQQVLY